MKTLKLESEAADTARNGEIEHMTGPLLTLMDSIGIVAKGAGK
jgi:hypothetical protein